MEIYRRVFTMSQLGFIEQLLDNTNRFYSVAFNQFDWWKKIQGTKCTVSRLAENNKYKRVFGSVASSTELDDSDLEKFDYVVLISMNDMKKLYQKSIDPLQFFDNNDKIQIGDIITFCRGKQEYKWKITEVQTFSEAEKVLQQYTMTGMTEVSC